MGTIAPIAELIGLDINTKNRILSFTDVLSSLAGFSGLSYPFTQTAADPCDSTCANPLP